MEFRFPVPVRDEGLSEYDPEHYRSELCRCLMRQVVRLLNGMQNGFVPAGAVMGIVHIVVAMADDYDWGGLVSGVEQWPLDEESATRILEDASICYWNCVKDGYPYRWERLVGHLANVACGRVDADRLAQVYPYMVESIGKEVVWGSKPTD